MEVKEIKRLLKKYEKTEDVFDLVDVLLETHEKLKTMGFPIVEYMKYYNGETEDTVI